MTNDELIMQLRKLEGDMIVLLPDGSQVNDVEVKSSVIFLSEGVKLSKSKVDPRDEVCPHGLHFNGYYCDECEALRELQCETANREIPTDGNESRG